MDSPKVIITNKEKLATNYFLENEVGLSTYDLALISINKAEMVRNESSNNTFLI